MFANKLMEYDDKACADMLQQIIIDALNVQKIKLTRVQSPERRKEVSASKEKVREFANRYPNPILEYFCEFHQVDERALRNALRKA